MADERDARQGLAAVVEPGSPGIHELLAEYAPEEVWAMLRRGRPDGAWARRAAVWSPRAADVLARKHGLRFVIPSDAEWPARLDDLATVEPVQGLGGTPLGLWVAGEAALADAVARSIAVVGARACSPYGERVAADLAAGLASGGVTVVSGGAYGIDAAAHRGALAEDGPTLAVLANGLDEVYPRAHEALLGRVREAGALVSEYAPGEHPTRPRFLARNRLIAALTQATVIVEAAARSGARNTVSWAAVCGRPVGAVPGPVSSALSFTPHRLIRDGEAVLVSTPAEVRELVAAVGQDAVVRPPQPRLLDDLTPPERAVYEALPCRGTRTAGELALRAGVAMPCALAALGSLADKRLVTATADAWKLGPVQDRPVRPRERT